MFLITMKVKFLSLVVIFTLTLGRQPVNHRDKLHVLRVN